MKGDTMRTLSIDGYTTTAGRAQAHATARLDYIDTLRVLLTILVVAHHAGQAYGPTGGAWPIFNDQRAAVLGPFFAVNAAFFMGLFFLISGYFLPGAYDRKGTGPFVYDRLLRLGVPLLITVLIFAPITYLSKGSQLSFTQYFFQVYIGAGQIEFGHLWFVAHLLVYALGYTAWRLATRRAPEATQRSGWVPGHRAILAYALALAAATFVVRIGYPIDRWERALGFISAEYAHWPQYFSLFLLGILAYRRDWLRRIPAATGMIWLGIGLAAAVLCYAYSLARPLGLLSLTAPGGLDWRSLVWSGWEALICVGLCVGLPVLLRERFARQGALLRWLSPNAYTVYIIHIWPIVALQFALASATLAPLAKFAIVTLVGVPLCFLLGALLRRLRYASKVL
jgi:peptidoglycan/LPS O-acetylase OafA/YrhL